jgi:hypothetical protein
MSTRVIFYRRYEEEQKPSSSTLADEGGAFFLNIGSQQPRRHNAECTRKSIVYVTNDEIEFSAGIKLVHSAYDYLLYSKRTP